MPIFRTVTGPSGPKPDQIAAEKPAKPEFIPEVGEILPDWWQLLTDAGFDDVEAIRQADDAELLAVEGIGPKRLRQIREATG